MYSNRTLTEELKFQFRHGGMHIKLIFANSVVFLAMTLLGLAEQITHNSRIDWVRIQFFTLQTNLREFAYAPYGLLTSIFTHFSLLHFLFNMIFLYFTGSLFKQCFSDRRMLHVYILGGIVGGIFELIANQFSESGAIVLGASGSIIALFIAIAVYKPNIQINIFGLFPLKIYIIALIYLVIDLLQAFKMDGTAHFAHLGGALTGLLSVQNLHSSSNIINWTESIHQRILSSFSGKKKRTKFKVQSGGRVVKSDEEYNMDTKARQERIDKILDKISKSGYESLTKAEKDFLFSQSNK
ncbi:rhomboid family intramembrane serine protease [Fluviicola sp.]|jgi:membrane associated rhomboid family serine protease|uniref:rhomboid family intramembrane serine protease n=1 Tax=Fluviicola sp. TaxID=1917219 RepID=UPI0028259BE5|nr:rhomboid family intramembrane serine protease [Fluviicola sp.]MDR0801779.1 rhomboid family intramembrane serine protease [Fluviicola sp.]